MSTLSREACERLLNEEIRKLARRGCQLSHSIVAAVLLAKPKLPSTFNPSCIPVIVTSGLWPIVAASKIVMQPIEEQGSLYVEDLEEGTIEWTKEGWLWGKVRVCAGLGLLARLLLARGNPGLRSGGKGFDPRGARRRHNERH